MQKDQNKRKYPYCELECKFLARFYPDVSNEFIAEQLGRSYRSVTAQAFDMGLKKSKEYLYNCAMKTAFTKGHVPANKGTKGFMKANSGTFKKGSVPASTKFDNCITIRHEKERPYQYIRLSKAKWLPLHIKLWTDKYGPVLKGNIVVFKDKDSMNCKIENLEMITRQENAERNRLSQHPYELRETIKMLNRLKRKIHEKHKSG